jgi:hypothetical protein
MFKKFFGSPIRISLASSGVGLFTENNFPWQKTQGEYDEHTFKEIKPFTHMHEQYEDALREIFTKKGISQRKISVILSDTDVRYFIVTPAKNSARLQDCKDAAYARFKALYGENHSEWEIEGEWHHQLPFLACATSKKMIGMLHRIANEFKLIIINITPQFISILHKPNITIGINEWLISCNDNDLVIGIMSSNRLHGIRTVNLLLKQEPLSSYLTFFIEQLAMQYELSPPESMHIYGNMNEELRKISSIKLMHTFPKEKITFNSVSTKLWQQTVSGMSC